MYSQIEKETNKDRDANIYLYVESQRTFKGFHKKSELLMWIF